MIILLYGQGKFFLQKKLNEIIEQIKKKYQNNISLEVFDFKEEELKFEEFKNFFAPSLFREKKIFIVKNSFSLPIFKEKIFLEKETFLKSEDIFIFIEREINPKDKLFSFLKQNATCYQFNEPTQNEIKREIALKLKKENLDIEPMALNLFLEYTNNNLWQIENEIEKIIQLKKEIPLKAINVEDIERLIKPIEFKNEIFKTIEAILKGKKKTALKLLRNQFLSGANYEYLLSMITYGFRNLILVKSELKPGYPYSQIRKISQKLQIHSFAVSKALEIINLFNFQEIKKIYNNLFEVETKVKSGKIDPQNALIFLITQI